jgi:hypothetical protein
MLIFVSFGFYYRFQEIVTLNARNVLGPKKRSASGKWNSLIDDALNNRRRRQGAGEAVPRCRGGEETAWHQEQQVTFRCVASKQMVGIFVTVWARSVLRRHVRHPGVSCVGAGVLGRLGNKVSKRRRDGTAITRADTRRHSHDGVHARVQGAVSVRFLLHGTSFCFVCCHLASGGEEGDALLRNADAADILARTSFHGAALSPEELPKRILDHE